MTNRPGSIAVASATLLLAAAVARAESVTFHFAPPVGAEFHERELLTTELRVGANRNLHSIASLSRLRIFKEGGSTFVAHRYEQMAASEDGGAYETPPQIQAMLGSEIVHVLRADGALARVDGYQRLAAKALPHMKGEAKASLEKYVKEGSQDNRDRATWFEVEMLVGQTLELDRDYWFDAAWHEEKGWIPHQTLVRLGPWAELAGRRLLTVSLAYVPNALAQMPAAVELRPKVKSRFDPRRPGTIGPNLKIEGASSWLIDPDTMLTWKVYGKRKVSEAISVSTDMGITFVTEQKVEKTLEPAPKAPKS